MRAPEGPEVPPLYYVLICSNTLTVVTVIASRREFISLLLSNSRAALAGSSLGTPHLTYRSALRYCCCCRHVNCAG
jgi:hypothetical protein